MNAPAQSPELELLEIQLLLEGIYRRYGSDLRDYAPASLRRRILRAVQAEGAATISRLQEKVLHDPACWKRFLRALTVNVTSMFRDPDFHLAFRRTVVPLLRDRPFIRLWHAGCSSGEEAFSIAILLEEEGLLGRCRIYATDLNDAALRRAREGIYPLSAMQSYEGDYRRAGGRQALSDYYFAKYDHAILSSALRRHLVFAHHDLARDGAFNEFDVILCRNVMIYFDKPLQERVHRLLYRSLGRFGVLGLGNKESISFTPHEKEYESLAAGERLYLRVG